MPTGELTIVAWKTKILVISPVGIASLITAPRGEFEMAKKTGIVIVTGIVVVTGIAKETERKKGIVITGIETESETETGTESEIGRGNGTEIAIVVMTRTVTGTLERNAIILPEARSLLLHSGMMTVVL